MNRGGNSQPWGMKAPCFQCPHSVSPVFPGDNFLNSDQKQEGLWTEPALGRKRVSMVSISLGWLEVISVTYTNFQTWIPEINVLNQYSRHLNRNDLGGEVGRVYEENDNESFLDYPAKMCKLKMVFNSLLITVIIKCRRTSSEKEVGLV